MGWASQKLELMKDMAHFSQFMKEPRDMGFETWAEWVSYLKTDEKLLMSQSSVVYLRDSNKIRIEIPLTDGNREECLKKSLGFIHTSVQLKNFRGFLKNSVPKCTMTDASMTLDFTFEPKE